MKKGNKYICNSIELIVFKSFGDIFTLPFSGGKAILKENKRKQNKTETLVSWVCVARAEVYSREIKRTKKGFTKSLSHSH